MSTLICVIFERPDYVLHENHTDRVNETIERIVEYAEEQEAPFTVSDCWKAVYGHHSISVKTIRSMYLHGLLVKVGGRRNPPRYISVDKYEEWQGKQRGLVLLLTHARNGR